MIRCCYGQARNKPADGGGHVNQKGPAGQKAAATTPVKKPPTAQKGQVKTQSKPAPPPVKATNNKKNKKGQRHQQHDLVVTINLVSTTLDNSIHDDPHYGKKTYNGRAVSIHVTFDALS